jgi:hypothetical protein
MGSDAGDGSGSGSGSDADSGSGSVAGSSMAGAMSQTFCSKGFGAAAPAAGVTQGEGDG